MRAATRAPARKVVSALGAAGALIPGGAASGWEMRSFRQAGVARSYWSPPALPGPQSVKQAYAEDR
ncbi:MAG: hypothetical protein M0005_12285 [Actinomycetota bacterium]|nr:hypothetical protein [Actinomycetota bacterium]